MKIEKGFSCSVSRTIKVDSISKAKEMEEIANNLIRRFGELDEYSYFSHSFECYPNKGIFKLNVQRRWEKGGRHNNSPIVYIEWTRCDFEAEFLMNKIIRECFDKEP